MIENGTLLQNRYLIEKQIGAGGMGAVYRAVDQRFDNYVAIKETFYTDDELGTAFEREARILNGLQHPALPHVSDYFSENNGYFLVMQFIEGEDLSDILKREGAFPVAEVVRWTDRLLDALDYLHSQNPPIIHRDIKPHNLKLSARGDVILLDFGLAKLNSGETTGAVSVFGYSRTYSPLEQIQGTGTDARSDIFSLGATIYHLLTGKPAIDALARASAIVGGKPDPLRLANEIREDVPEDIATLLHSALALNPDQRFNSANAMRQALEFAGKEIAGENTQDSSADAAVAVAPVVPLVNSAENENFPALEAFAEAVNAPIDSDAHDSPTVKVLSPVDSVSAPQRAVSTPSTEVVEMPTQVSPVRQRKSFLPVAALAAALIGGLLTIFYFTAGANSANDTNQNPVAQTVSASETDTAEKSASDSDSRKTQNETHVQPKSKTSVVEASAGQSKTSDETSDTAEQTGEKVDESKRASSIAEVSKPAPVVKTPRRSQPQTQPEESVEERTRVVADEPVSDIESIFTGQSPDNEDNVEPRENNRGRRNQMSNEERRQRRRERQEKRRQNRQNFPPF